MKYKLFSSIILIILLLIILFTVGFKSAACHETDDANMITQKETAISIGSAIIKAHFPEEFPKIKNFDAIEKDGIWKVFSDDNVQTDENGTERIFYGGSLFVEFRKSNGEILKIGIDD